MKIPVARVVGLRGEQDGFAFAGGADICRASHAAYASSEPEVIVVLGKPSIMAGLLHQLFFCFILLFKSFKIRHYDLLAGSYIWILNQYFI